MSARSPHLRSESSLRGTKSHSRQGVEHPASQLIRPAPGASWTQASPRVRPSAEVEAEAGVRVGSPGYVRWEDQLQPAPLSSAGWEACGRPGVPGI